MLPPNSNHFWGSL